MKKVLLTGLMVLGVGSLAFAQYGGMGNGPDYGPGYGQGYGPGHGHMRGGYGNCGGCWNGGPGAQVETTVKNAEEARAKVQEVIKNNFKGYKIDKTESYNTPRGQMYNISVKDAGGNSFMFHVTPWGQVRGPILNK